LGLAALLVIFAGALVSPLVSAPLVIVWAKLSKTPWPDLGYIRPKNWFVTIVAATATGIVFKLILKALVMPLFGANPINRAYHDAVHNPAVLAGILLYIPVGAGFAEETFFRGYLFERCRKLFGDKGASTVLMIAVSAAMFGTAHFPSQGLDGALQALIVGIAFGIFFASRKQLVPLMVAHAAFDATTLAIIYWNLESRIAHLIFR
jgi:uncharacterized protein